MNQITFHISLSYRLYIIYLSYYLSLSYHLSHFIYLSYHLSLISVVYHLSLISSMYLIFLSFHPSDYLSAVQQFDFHLPTLTVKETLLFHAKIRLPMSYSIYNRLSRVDQVIMQLGLHQCCNTRVGDELLKGISGGEKRRLS